MSRTPRTPLRSALTRLAITAASGALVAAAAAVPATADNGWGQDQGGDTSAAQHDQGGGDDGDGGWSHDGQQGETQGQEQGQEQGQGQGQEQGQEQGQDPGRGQNEGGGQGQVQGQGQGQGQGDGQGEGQDEGREQGQDQGQRNARGVVTARELRLRSAPNRGGKVLRVLHRGEVVSIYCRTRGQSVDGNPVWYLLPDGTWAWGPARYIDVIGHAPRWC